MTTFLDAAIIVVVTVAIVLIAIWFLNAIFNFFSSKENSIKEYWVEDTSLDDYFDVDYE